jgi:hypothetical protein
MCHAGRRRSPKQCCSTRFGLQFKVGARSRPATEQEIELVARTIVERLQQANW